MANKIDLMTYYWPIDIFLWLNLAVASLPKIIRNFKEIICGPLYESTKKWTGQLDSKDSCVTNMSRYKNDMSNEYTYKQKFMIALFPLSGVFICLMGVIIYFLQASVYTQKTYLVSVYWYFIPSITWLIPFMAILCKSIWIYINLLFIKKTVQYHLRQNKKDLTEITKYISEFINRTKK